MTRGSARCGDRLRSRVFPPPIGPRLRAALAQAHAEDLFRPTEPREAARRTVELGDRLGLEGTLFRGVVDLGNAEADHVWAVIDGRVVDAAFPLFASGFVDRLRAYVAGDLDARSLERAAHPYSVRWRVIGSYPRAHRYLGQPLWSSRSGSTGPR